MKFKRLIIVMLVLITSIIISIKDINASTGKIEVFFTVGGQRELTKSYLDSKSTTHPTYGKILMMDINVMSISGNNEGLSTLEFSIETNDIFQGIITTNPQTYERVVPNPDDDFFGYPKWSTNGTSSNNFIAVTDGGDDALIKPSPSKIATVIMRYNGDVVEENFEIKLTLEVAAHDSGEIKYLKSEISLPSIIIGDPNSTPDATLSALNITGTTTSKVYDFNVSATEEEGKISQNITIDYQDSIGGLTINPVFTKTSLGSSNYVKTESKASTNYQTGDTITIKTTDGEQSKIYEIKLTVSSASTNTGIELNLAQGDLGTITFNSEKNRYEIVTPFTENDIKILATTAYPYATLDKNEIRVTNIEQDVFTHIGDFNVTAENGSTTTNYPVYVKREKGSSDATIKIITNEHPQGLAPVGNVFTINYPHTKTSLSFQIAKNQTGQTIKYKEVGTTSYITYTTGIISKSSLETGETYSYEVIVTPESQFANEIVTYIVNFVIEPSNDTSIKTGDIKVQESGLTAINLNITNLVYTVSNNSSEFVTLTIDPGSKREAKIGEGTYQSAQLIHQISVASLNYGTNNFILTIKAQDGTEKEYTIKIEKKSDQAELESIVFRTDDGTVIANLDDFTFISSENKYTYSFDYGLFPSNLKLETKTSAKSIIKGTTTNQLITPLDFSGMYEVIKTTSLEVTSENGAVVNNYTIQITRNAADSNNDISAINIGGSPFTQFRIGDSNVTYKKVIVEPVGGINTLNFEVLLPTTSKATVKVGPTTFTKNETGRYSTNIPFVRGIEQNVTIIVTAQNGEKNTIIIPFVVATNDTTLKTLNIEGTDFVFDPAKLNNTININYSFNSNVTITASPQNVDSKVYIDGQVRVNDTYVKAIGNGTTTFKVWVESEAGTKGSEYVINIVRAQAKTDNNLESFVLKTNNGEIIDLGFLSSKTNYTITIDDREELWPLIYTAQVNEQNYAYIGTKGTTSLIDQQFNVSSGTISNLTIQVYSEGGVLKTYTISIKRANDVKTFESVTISGTGFVTQTFSADQFISGVLDIGNIAYNIDRLNVTFNMVDGSKSTVETNFIGNNQSGIWLFSKTGLIEGQFRVKSQAGNFGEYLKIRVNRQVAQTHKNLDNLEVMVNGNNILLDFDPTTNTYTLRVDRQVNTVTFVATVLSSDRSSVQTPFSLTDTSGLNHRYTYTYNLNDPAAQPSNVIDIIVKAEDGTSNTYKVTIWRKNVEIGIDNIVIKNGSTVIYTGDILSVPNLGEFDFQTNQLTFIVTPKDRFARVSFNGGTTLFADEDGLITYTHTLVVGINQTITLRIQSDLLSTEYPIEAKSQNYNFTYTRNEASTLAELDSLEIIVGGTNLLDGVFDSSIIRYEGAYLRVDRTHMSVQIKAVGKEFSTVTGLGIKEIKPGITNSYTVTVTSQSGTHSKEYTVYIVSKNDDHEINNIKVNSKDIGFIDSEFEYTLDNVLYTVSSLPIQVILNDTFANYYVNGVKNATSIPLVYGNNIIEIYGESEYGTKSGNTYRLNIYRNEPYKDTDISSLSITNISNGQNIVYKADGTNYLVELPDTSSISNVKVDIELKNTDKQVLESTFNLSNIVLTYNGEGGLDQTITFKVSAEDNSTKTYQIRFVKNIVLSSDNSLSNVSIKNQDNQVVTFPFDELLANNSVVLNLPYSQKSLNIEITPTHNKAQVTPNKLNNISLVVGENTFEFSITAEDGTVSDPYTITIHRQAASKDINLNNLTVTDPLNSGLYLLGLDTLSPKGITFNPTTKTYNIKLDETYINEEIIINIVKGHIAQTITGPINAPLTLNHGTNRFEIFIKAEDETVTQGKYTIIIEVLYKSNSLQSLTVDGKALTVQDVNYFDTEKESVTITPVLTHPTHGSFVIKDSLGNVVTNTPNLNFDENVFTIEIKNEYGEIVKTHTLEITRLKSSEKTLSNVSLIGSNGTNYITFDPLTLTYTVEVPQNVEHVTLGATIPAKATATGLGKYIINLDETITITFKVTAEDGSESEIYTIGVTRRALSTNNHLEEISIIDTLDPTNYLIGISGKNPDIVFDKTTNNYVINLGLEYLDIKYRNLIIRYVKSDTYQTVDKTNPSTLTLNKGANVFVVTVLAEDSINTQPFIYTITINVLNKENDLKHLTINGDVQDTSSNEIHYTTEEEQANILSESLFNDGSIILKDKVGKVITSPLNLEMGENKVSVEVLNAYNEVVQVYEVIITRLASSDNDFTATLTNETNTQLLNFDKDINTYHVNVDYLTTEVTLAIVKNAKATSFGEGVYTLVSGETKEITFYVEAENGDLSPLYTVYVTRLFNTEDKLANLGIKTNLEDLLTTANFDPENNLYQFSLNEYHTNVTFSYIANYGQTLSGTPFNVAQPLTHGLNVFEIEVQPEDLAFEAFIIRVEITIINSEIDLQNLFIDGVDRLLPGESIIRLEDVSSDKKTLDIEAVLTDLYGTVKINGNLSEHFIVDILPGENTIKIDVTSEDGSTTKTYTVLVKQLLDDLDTLDNILVKTQDNLYLLGDASVNPQIVFDALTNTYKFVVNETVEHIMIDVTNASTKQTVTGDLRIPLNIKHGINRFEISVQPEDLNKPARTYLIEVEKVNDEIIIDQLLVGQTDIYEEGVLDYVMDSVTNDQKTIKVIPMISNFGTYVIYDTEGNLVQNHDVNLSFGQNTIRIVFTSESGKTTKTITLTIEQTYSSDNQIIDVRFFDASTNINRLNFDPEITTYDLEFPASTTIARLRVETHNKALVFINGVQEINTRKDFNLTSGNTITVKFYVIAENGDKGIEYTINVYKRKATDPVLSDNTNLLDVTIEIPINKLKFDFDPTIYEYNIQLPFGHDEMYIKGHTESKAATVFGEGAYALIPGLTKVIRLRVTAEDGTVAEKEYKFNITRALPNTDTTLKTLVIEDVNGNILAFDQSIFNPENRTYNITLNDDMKLNTVHVLAEKNHETQILYNTGIIQLHGEVEGYYNTIITVTVVAEDGSIGEYIIYVLHDLDFASLAEVKDISILGDDGISYFGLEFKNNIYVYEDILVPFNVDTTRLIVQTIGNVIYLDASNTEIEDNRLQSFGVGSQIVYRFRIESTNGSNTSEVYTIYVNRQLPDTNSLLETLEINGEMVRGFNPDIFEYTIVHPLQFEKYLDIYGVAQSDNSTVKGNDVYTLIEGQTRTITIEVKAQSGDVSSYKLHISYVNSNALLGELTVYEMIGEHDIQNTIPLLDDTLEYTIIIGKHTRYVNIKGFAKDQGGASIRGFGIREIGSEDTVVHITVTSGDGLEELTYVLTLRRDTSLSNLKEITLLQINNEEVITSDENDPFVYKYSLSNGTQSVKLNAVANNSSKVSINGSEYSTNNMGEIILTDIQESQVIKISVQAEDGSIQHYMVIIEKPQQPSLLLTILLIISIVLWVIAAMTYILKRIRKNNKKDKNQLIF